MILHKKIKTLVSAGATLLFLLLPVVASAQNKNCGDSGSNKSLINLSKYCTIPELLFGSLNYLLVFIGVIATIMIIYGGFLMVLSAGNEERLTQGKKTIMWAIIGLVVALLAFSIVSIVQNLL